MTTSLQQAFAEAAKLPADEQNLLASRLLAELEAEDAFDRAIAQSSDKLAGLAAEALAEHDFDVEQRTVAQRLDLIGRLWDSIPDTMEALPMPECHRQELERRLADADANPETGIPWEVVKGRRSGE